MSFQSSNLAAFGHAPTPTNGDAAGPAFQHNLNTSSSSNGTMNPPTKFLSTALAPIGGHPTNGYSGSISNSLYNRVQPSAANVSTNPLGAPVSLDSSNDSSLTDSRSGASTPLGSTDTDTTLSHSSSQGFPTSQALPSRPEDKSKLSLNDPASNFSKLSLGPTQPSAVNKSTKNLFNSNQAMNNSTLGTNSFNRQSASVQNSSLIKTNGLANKDFVKSGPIYGGYSTAHSSNSSSPTPFQSQQRSSAGPALPFGPPRLVPSPTNSSSVMQQGTERTSMGPPSAAFTQSISGANNQAYQGTLTSSQSNTFASSKMPPSHSTTRMASVQPNTYSNAGSTFTSSAGPSLAPRPGMQASYTAPTTPFAPNMPPRFSGSAVPPTPLVASFTGPNAPPTRPVLQPSFTGPNVPATPYMPPAFGGFVAPARPLVKPSFPGPNVAHMPNAPINSTSSLPLRPAFSQTGFAAPAPNMPPRMSGPGMQSAGFPPPNMPPANTGGYKPPVPPNTGGYMPPVPPNTGVAQSNFQAQFSPVVAPPPTNFGAPAANPSTAPSGARRYAAPPASQTQQYRPPPVGAYNNQPMQQSGPPSGQQSSVRDGFSKGWGQDYIDLLQNRHILPSEEVEPPTPVIPQNYVVNCSPDLLRCTLTKVPESKSILQKSRMPFGIIVHPFKDMDKLPVVSCQQIVRCRSCRTYINPFVVFRGERRWECNLCYTKNEVPEEYNYDPVSQTYGDPSRRPEVRESTIEYIAPTEYMLRPPQPAAYLWVLDTSRQAIETGYLKVVCDTLLQNLSQIPGDKRALIGFITFSSTVQFYLMPDNGQGVEMLEVGDIDDIFLPYPDDLLVNIHEQREQIEQLLTSLPDIHSNTTHRQSALGPALQAAQKLLNPLGGRMTVLTGMLPTIGPGALKAREDPNQRASKDVPNLNPATDFYKKIALDCSAAQVAIDLFTLNSQYIDLATLSGISKFSGGCMHHFPNLSATDNIPSMTAFTSCLQRYITRKIGFEAVMRIRATRGLEISNFHGHFFVRSTDLLALPNVNPDAGYAMQICIEESLTNIQTACFQVALLYTSSKGERRIRVHTLCVPVTGNVHDVVQSADQQACVALIARMAVDRCLASTSGDARDGVVNAAIDALSAYRNCLTRSPGRALVAPHNLKLWPLYTLALLKSMAFRTGLSTKADDRVAGMVSLKTQPCGLLLQELYPDLYPVHQLTVCGQEGEDDVDVVVPPRLQLSAENLAYDGAYLADAGSRLILFVREGVSADFLQQCLGVASFASLPPMAHHLPELLTAPSELLRTFVAGLQRAKPHAAPLLVLREDSPARMQFTQLLVDDRADGSKSYMEFLQFLATEVK